MYIVMDLYTQNLDELYRQGNQPSRDVTLSIFSQIAQAILFVHSNHYVHRDLKPKNILVRTVDEDNLEVAVGDFGLCRRIEGSTGFNGNCGTPPYNTAPELFSSTKLDMWSLGILMFEILYITSEGSPSPSQVDRAITQLIEIARDGNVDKLKQHAGRCVRIRSMKTIIVHCLHRDPACRISAEETCNKDCMQRSFPF